MRILTVLMLCVFTSGCATVFSGERQKVKVTSNPEGAEISINGSGVGMTPTDATIKRSNGTYLQFDKKGYESHSARLAGSINPGWLTWDILSCVIPVALCIPLILDAITGSWYGFDDSVQVTLKKQ